MFGFHISVMESGSKLVVSNPADTIMLLLLMVFTVWPCLIFLFQRPMPKSKVLIFTIVTLLFYGYFVDCTRLTLDRSSARARIDHFQWFHWTTNEFSSDKLAGAYLAAGRASDRIVLQYKNGSTQSFSVSNQMGGKPAAVLAINRFLGRSAPSLMR